MVWILHYFEAITRLCRCGVLRFDFSGIFTPEFGSTTNTGLGDFRNRHQAQKLFNELFYKGKLSHGGRCLSIGADGNVGDGRLLRMGPVGSRVGKYNHCGAKLRLSDPGDPCGLRRALGRCGRRGIRPDLANSNEDASAGVAIGLGDPDAYFGAELGVGFSSLTNDNSEDSFGESGGFSFKLHRNLPGYSAVSVGVNGFGVWGGAEDANDPSYYAAYSKMVPVGRFASILTIGAGTEVFNDPGEDGANVFGSAALYLTPQVALIGEYTGRFANVAVSVAPYSWLPMTVTVGAVNVTERYDADTELAVSVGFGFNFT